MVENGESARRFAISLNGGPTVPFERTVTNTNNEQLALSLDSELPTEPAPERSALAARLAAKVQTKVDEDVWCDSEAPTGVEAERPLFPPPPRAPRV